ncbi:MAG: NAD-dependent succinate-semialdehyde dehydrogenase [Bacteroidota bacterium]
MELKNNTLWNTKPYINNTWIDTNQQFKVYNPFDGKEIAEVGDCGIDDTKAAIAAAKEAFSIWSNYSASKRARILKNWYRLQLENATDLAKILTYEQGKPLAEAIGEIKYGASYVEWFAEEARRVYGDTIPGQSSSKRVTVIKQAIGVVAAITPWNFPSAMITRKVAPALAAGCTVVIKPSELTPLSALALMPLAEKAGFPPGVLNVITTNDAPTVGMEMTTNPLVRKVSFTGSTEVGKILLKQSASTVKKVSLELGGNAPFIVFDDADVDKAVKGAIASKFRNAGQTCVCANRIFAQASIYDEFVEKLSIAMKDLKLGNGMEDGVHVGPLIEEKALHFVEEMVEDAKENGGTILSGGKLAEGQTLIYEPTLIKDAHQDMKVFKNEIFGPVAPVFKFETEEEVIAFANNTNYGLASYFFGRDYARIWRVAEALEYGMVGINTGLIGSPTIPFGGVKESGIGREGSKYGIEDYLNIKYMCWDLS